MPGDRPIGRFIMYVQPLELYGRAGCALVSPIIKRARALRNFQGLSDKNLGLTRVLAVL